MILIVDDDALVLMNSHAMLEDLGHTAISASSGREALEILAHRSDVDLVITDHAMPQMTGLALAEAIGKEWPALPVILATGYAEMEAGVRARWRKLLKPYTEADLDRVIGLSLRDRKALALGLDANPSPG
jgi:CheY-like chemotaxis protein